MEERSNQSFLREFRATKQARQGRRKASKSKSRGHKKLQVNNVKHKPEDLKEGWEYTEGK